MTPLSCLRTFQHDLHQEQTCLEQSKGHSLLLSLLWVELCHHHLGLFFTFDCFFLFLSILTIWLLLQAGLRSRLLDLQGEVHHRAALCDAAQRDDVHMRGQIERQAFRNHSTAGFYHHRRELLLERLSCGVQLLQVGAEKVRVRGEGGKEPPTRLEPCWT